MRLLLGAKARLLFFRVGIFIVGVFIAARLTVFGGRINGGGRDERCKSAAEDGLRVRKGDLIVEPVGEALVGGFGHPEKAGGAEDHDAREREGEHDFQQGEAGDRA